MDSITITLPVPPPAVRPNGRPHWRAKAKAVKGMRVQARMSADIARYLCKPPAVCRAEGWTHASIKIDWYHPTSRFLDRDNIIASIKAYVDGFSDAGVLDDDYDVTYDEDVGRFKAKKGEDPHVIITITPTEPPDA